MPAKNSAQYIEQVSESAWKNEMRAGANYYHRVGVWVAIIFDPIFGITDFINIPEKWQQIFVLRLLVSACSFVGLQLFKKGIISTYLLVAIPFALISMQNAYTYSLIDADDILGHNLNYLALFLGASLFLLWPLYFSVIAIALSVFATFAFVALNPNLTLADFALEGGLLLATGAIFTIFMIEARFRLRLKEVKARLALQDSLAITARQKDEISYQNEQLLVATKELKKAKSKIEQMNTQLLLNNDLLEQQVNNRTEKLRKANKEMDQLVYSLSHDFRTPLVNVRGLIDLANYVDEPDALKELIEKMGVSVNRFDELLRDMMNYAVYWDEVLHPKKADVSEILQNKWKHFGYLHQNKITLQWQPKNQPSWQVYTDYEKLRVLIYCLLSNAVSFNKENGSIEIVAKTSSEGLQLTISDTGQGIAEQHLPKVFDMFYRGNAKSQGAGMGLYIAKGVVEQLGGTISLQSTEHVGTSVNVFIPNLPENQA